MFSPLSYAARRCNVRTYFRKLELISFFGLALFWALSANAQVTTADVVGTVHDPTGAVVPNAKVSITNTGTGLTRTAQTGPSGDYVVNLLEPGTYSIKVEAPSFKTFSVPSLTLASGDRTRVD